MQATVTNTPAVVDERDKKRYDALIVSAFGRGNWLASHLSEHDWRVALLDVTPSLGEWAPADWDGPFGLFESGALLASQKRQWLQNTETPPTGFTFWLPGGPLEGRGPLADFGGAAADVSAEARSYLQHLSDEEESDVRRLRSSLRGCRFQDSWLAHLAHQVAANTYEDNDVALDKGQAIPFYSPYFQRAVGPGLLEEGLRVCETRGVEVYRAAQPRHLHFTGSWPSREWSALTLADGTSLEAFASVWTLGSGETEIVCADGFDELFPNGKIEPTWCWLRFEMSVATSPVSDSMPDGFAVVGDVHLPWTHANLAHVRKSATSSSGRQGLDVWARVPVSFRFDRAYLTHVQDDLVALLQAKLPLSHARAERLPLDLEHGATSLRAPRWPIFADDASIKTLQLKNFVIDGPDQWLGLDPLSQFRSQKKTLVALEHQKRLRDERHARAQVRNQIRNQKRELRTQRRRARTGAAAPVSEDDRD